MVERFILLAYPRTGSSLVGHALQAHPAVAMYGELFHPVEKFRQHVITAPQEAPYPLDDCYREGGDPVEYLEKHFYSRTYPPEKKALGFKLFHMHLRGPLRERLFGWLAGDPALRVIHLYRQRLLEEFVSLQRALVTNQWGIEAGADEKPAESPPLTLDVERFKHYADATLGDRAQVPEQFRGHPMLTIEYQADVVAQYDATVRRIEEFLGVAAMPLPQRLKKQARRPVEEEVANLTEVRAALKGTRYEALL